MLGHIHSYLGVHVIPGLGSPGGMKYLLEPSPNQVMRPTLNRSLSFHFLHVGIFFFLFYELKYGCENIFSARVCGFVGCGNSHQLLLCCCWNPETSSLFMLLKRPFMFLSSLASPHHPLKQRDCISMSSTPKLSVGVHIHNPSSLITPALGKRVTNLTLAFDVLC